MSVVNARYSKGSVFLARREGDEVEVDYPDCFFVTDADAAKLPKDWKTEPEGESWVRVFWPRDSDPGKARLKYYFDSLFGPREIRLYEADVDPITRFFVEHPKVAIERNWRVLWYDLETEKIDDWDKPWRSRILSFSWMSSDGRSGHVRAKSVDDEGERRLLSTFIRIADRHDVLCAWNGSRFDDKVVKGRCTLLDLPFDKYSYHWIDHLTLFKRYYLRSEDGGVTSSFALDRISEALLKEERKIPVEEEARKLGYDGRTDLFRWLWENAPKLLEEYNNQDVRLMKLLEEKTGFIALHFAICQLCRVLPTSRSLFPSRLIDGRMFQLAWPNYHFPSRYAGDDEPDFVRARGAFVPRAKIGVHNSVAVLDYARMYPSIIRTFNLSPDTLSEFGSIQIPDTTEFGERTGEVLARFKSEPEGLLPAALRAVLDLRVEYSARQGKADVGSPEWHDAGRLSQACKVLANSFYGIVLSPYSRYYCSEIGESVTTIGRLLLSETRQTVLKLGHEFIFGDTDSVAFVADDDEANHVKDTVNKRVIPAIVKSAKQDPKKSEIKIEYEKRYRRVLVTASKRYAGKFALYKGKPADDSTPIDIRGLEIVRSDVCKAARALQRDIVNQILETVPTGDLETTVVKMREKLAGGEIPLTDLILAKTITKKVSEYSSEPPQVKVAKRMMEQGLEVGVGDKIPILFTPKGPVHPTEFKDVLQVEEYWNKYIYTPTERVLHAAYPALKWNRFRFPKGWDPRQGELFALEGEAPVRRVRKVKKKPEAASVPVNRVRRTKPRIVVVHSDTTIDPDKLRRLLEAFPGGFSFQLHVRDGKKIYELDCPQKIQHPDKSAALAGGLRSLGLFKWEVRSVAG